MPRTTAARTKKKSVTEAPSTSIVDYIEKLNKSSGNKRIQKKAEASSASENRQASKTNNRTKKRGLTERNTIQEQTAEVMKTKAKPQPRRKRTEPASTSTSSSQRASKKQKQPDYDEEQYTERVVSAKAASRWKKLSIASKQYVIDTLDNAIVYVLNETRPSNYDDVQDSLNILRQRIVGSLPILTVPNVRQPDYRHMEEQCHSMEVSVAEASNQVELLETEIDNQLRSIEEKERILEEMKSDAQTPNTRRRIHPILQTTNQESLQLPAVKLSSAKTKQISTTSSTHHKKLVDVLKKWQSQDSVQDMTTFMDSLSNVASTL